MVVLHSAWTYYRFTNRLDTVMPRVNVYLSDETYEIWQTLENKSEWVQDKLYELEENKDGETS